MPYAYALRLLAFAAAALAAALPGVRAQPAISEFMAANTRTLADEDGAFSDWIEIHNPDSTPLDLAGWYLTDSSRQPAKWSFPAVTVPPGGYLIVFASNKNRAAAGAPLHTNFALSAGGEYLALVRPDGVTVAHEFAPEYPEQSDDVSYGLVATAAGLRIPGFLAAPTPGAANSGGGSGSAAPAETVGFSHPSGPFRESFLLELAHAGGGVVRYVVGTGADAGTVVPSASSPAYSGPIPINRTSVVRAAVFSEDGSSHGPVATAYFGKIGAGVANFSSRLPVAIIDTLGAGTLVKDGVDRPSWFALYGNLETGTRSLFGAPGVVSPLEAAVRGSSSADFPKKGYNFKFRDDRGGDRDQALLDLPAFEKWAFVAPWRYDLTYFSNAFLYSLSERLGHWAPRVRFVEVFVNGNGDDIDGSDYAGIYAITDRIEVAPGRVDLEKLSARDTSGDAVTGGYLLKIDPPGDDELVVTPPRLAIDDPHSALVVASPKLDDLAPAQAAYIRDYVGRLDSALHHDRATGWAQRTYLDFIDRASWVDFHLLNVFSSNPDAFVRSTFFHKHRGGKLKAGPVWDFDRALGSTHDERSSRSDVWFGTGVTDYWRTGWFGLLAEDPEFMQDWVDRWQSLRTAALTDHNLATLVDSLTAGIGNTAAARDAARWPDSLSPWGDHAATSRLTRDWVVNRARWIDSQFVAAPTLRPDGGNVIVTPAAGARLVYTLDGSDPRLLGGDLAPDALVSDGPVTVPAEANLHARSYRADLRDVFPGSPWSSAVGTAASSPLAPQSRIVNLSSRARVGTGEDALIAGVVVADTAAKRFLTRAVGPALGVFGASGYVPDPQLGIFSGAGTELFRNHGWESGPEAALLPSYHRTVGAFPLAVGSSDSALAPHLPAGAFTVQVSTPTGRDGIGLAELYETDTLGRTVNLSTRAHVRTGDGVLIGGLVLSGSAHKRILLRAVGPTLSAFGLEHALRDPIVTVYSGTNAIASNDRWGAADNAPAVAAYARRAGAFPLAADSEDAALLLTLPPGAYTIEVRGKAGSEGIALLEVYDVP